LFPTIFPHPHPPLPHPPSFPTRRSSDLAWRAHKDRFWLYVNYSNALRESFPDDLEHDLEQGAVGWKYMPVFYGFLADNHGFLPGYEVCRRHKASIIIDLCSWLIGPFEPYRAVSPKTLRPGAVPAYPPL